MAGCHNPLLEGLIFQANFGPEKASPVFFVITIRRSHLPQLSRGLPGSTAGEALGSAFFGRNGRDRRLCLCVDA